MERAPDVGHHFGVVRLAVEQGDVAADRLQYFLGFLDEDREQLGVELFLVGLRQLQGFG